MNIKQLILAVYPSEVALIGNARLERLVAMAQAGRSYESEFRKNNGSALHFDLEPPLQFLRTRLVHIFAVFRFCEVANRLGSADIRPQLLSTFGEGTETGRWLRFEGERLIDCLEQLLPTAS